MEKNTDFAFETEKLSMTPPDTPQQPVTPPPPLTTPPCASKEEHGCAISETLVRELVKALTPRPFRKRHPILFWGGLVLFVCMVGSAVFSLGETPDIVKDNRIALVRVEGVIANTAPLLKWIDKIKRDDSVKGVLLRIDSPGGGAAASQELYDALHDLAAVKPMVASMGSVAASGGLMAAMAAKRVVANASTVTGSIGVRMDVPQLQGLMGKLGIGQETLTTGRYKDAGSVTRPLSADEKAYLRGIIQDMHDQFVLLVAEGRQMPVEKVRPLADGRIFTGREARELGLVDEIGGQSAALKIVRQMAEVKESTPLYEQPKPSKLWQELAESLLGVEIGTRGQGPVFSYQY